jgi:hypothetical protein
MVLALYQSVFQSTGVPSVKLVQKAHTHSNDVNLGTLLRQLNATLDKALYPDGGDGRDGADGPDGAEDGDDVEAGGDGAGNVPSNSAVERNLDEALYPNGGDDPEGADGADGAEDGDDVKAGGDSAW